MWQNKRESFVGGCKQNYFLFLDEENSHLKKDVSGVWLSQPLMTEKEHPPAHPGVS